MIDRDLNLCESLNAEASDQLSAREMIAQISHLSPVSLLFRTSAANQAY
jgi:hypothetical protein